jgi:hypothetical protein
VSGDRYVNAATDEWRAAVEAGDTFHFAKLSGDRALIRTVRQMLRDRLDLNPLSRDMLALADLENGINGVVEKARKLDQLETVLNEVDAPDREVIERIASAFYD